MDKQNPAVLSTVIEQRLGRRLTETEKDILDTNSGYLRSELEFPTAARRIVDSLQAAFNKTARASWPGGTVFFYSRPWSRGFRRANVRNPLLAYSLLGLFFVVALVFAYVISASWPQLRVIVLQSVILLLVCEATVIMSIHDKLRLIRLFDNNRSVHRLLTGLASQTELDDIHAATPWPWNALFMRQLPNDLESNALLVAWNLDWYLKPSKVHFRWSWLVLPLACALAVGSGILNGVSYGLTTSILLLIYPAILLHSHESWRKMTGLAILIDEAKRTFSVPVARRD